VYHKIARQDSGRDLGVVDVDGRVLVLAMIRDITARRRADAARELG
jgi:hypothetical protein